MLRRWAKKVPILRWLVRKARGIRLHGWVTGYRCLKCVSTDDYQGYKSENDHQIISPDKVMAFPLPCNISSRSQLTQVIHPGCGHTFWDVPELAVSKSSISTLRNCHLVRCFDKWGNSFYGIVSEEGYSVGASGIGYRPGHRQHWKKAKTPVCIDTGTMCFGLWYDNYSLWHTTYVTRLMLAKQYNKKNIILPDSSRLKEFHTEVLRLLHIPSSVVLGENENSWHFNELTVIQEYPYRGTLLQQFRNEVSRKKTEPWRKVFISRERTNRRKLENSTDVLPHFVNRGWQVVILEDLCYSDQIELMSETKALAGLHGAGFANMVFMPAGGHVYEFNVRQHPNANVYALACAMGHHYWLGVAETTGTNRAPAYDNASVDISSIENVLAQIDERIHSGMAVSDWGT